MAPAELAKGERWTICAADHVHWGANGGARLLFRNAATGSEPKYLLARRSRWVDEGEAWGIPGGAIKDGESPEVAARRETLEEMGRMPPYHVRNLCQQDCGGGWVFHIIVADVDSELAAYSVKETDETGWFTASALRRLPLHPGIRRWINDAS